MPEDQPGDPLESQSRADGPRQVPSRPGRYVTVAGLIERVIEQFEAEFGSDRSGLPGDTTPVQRRGLVRDVAQYTFGVESVTLSRSEQAEIIHRAYSELFGYGPLDALLTNPRLTTISLEGARHVAVRTGPGGDLEPQSPLFDDTFHLERIIKRMLRDGGVELRQDVPVVEVGLIVEGRPVTLSVAGPPYSTPLTADIRLHPPAPVSLASLVESGMLTEEALEFLRALALSQHGIIIAGDTESGKTTLLSALLQILPTMLNEVHVVEWAAALHLPEGATRHVVGWPVGDAAMITLLDRVREALAGQPKCLILDEVRSDEPEAIAPLLTADSALRQLWSVRASSDPKRLRSALGMLARRADAVQPELMVQQIYRRLPFVVTLRRRRGSLQLQEIAEWQAMPGSDYAEYVPLFSRSEDGLRPTGRRPQHALELPPNYFD